MGVCPKRGLREPREWRRGVAKGWEKNGIKDEIRRLIFREKHKRMGKKKPGSVKM